MARSANHGGRTCPGACVNGHGKEAAVDPHEAPRATILRDCPAMSSGSQLWCWPLRPCAELQHCRHRRADLRRPGCHMRPLTALISSIVTQGSVARVLGRLAALLERWDEAEGHFEMAACRERAGRLPRVGRLDAPQLRRHAPPPRRSRRPREGAGAAAAGAGSGAGDGDGKGGGGLRAASGPGLGPARPRHHRRRSRGNW